MNPKNSLFANVCALCGTERTLTQDHWLYKIMYLGLAFTTFIFQWCFHLLCMHRKCHTSTPSNQYELMYSKGGPLIRFLRMHSNGGPLENLLLKAYPLINS